MEAHLDPAAIRALARVAGIEIPVEDSDLLAAVLSNQLDAMKSAQSVDVTAIEPIVSFDPRWR